MSLSKEEVLQYARHFSLREIGHDGQLKLKNARVLCVGAGGLGCPVLSYLSAAGIGTLGIVDDDVVDLSNLQRQILYTIDDVGLAKVQIAKSKLSRTNPHITIIDHKTSLQANNALDLFDGYDVVLDCTDNFASRYLINDACFHLGIPLVYASIFQFEGHCSVFCTNNGPCYRCLYQEAPPPGLMPNCAEGGVVGALPGILGSIQAMETIKLLLSIGQPLIGRLLQIDALSMNIKSFAIEKRKGCLLCTHKTAFDTISRQDVSCANTDDVEPSPNSISPKELEQLLKKSDVFLLDVRESWENELCHIGGVLIPLSELPNKLEEMQIDKPIVAYCKSGVRSQKAIELLNQKGYTSSKSLAGGILAWIDQIDASLTRY